MSLRSALEIKACFNSFFALFNSFILLDNRETETGFPPKFEPEPKTILSTPTTGPTSSDILEETIEALILSGRCSPGKRLIIRLALEAPFPKVLIEFTKRLFPVPLRYFSVNSLFTILDVSSIIVIIESVILSFVPLGITRFMEILSEAIEGKKEVLMIPPPNEPIVREKNAINIDITRKRLFKENLRKGK